MVKRKKLGRPLKESTPLARRIAYRVTVEKYEAIERAAGEQSPHEFARDAAVEKAERIERKRRKR